MAVTGHARSTGSGGKLSLMFGALLCFSLLSGSGCQQKSEATDQTAQVQTDAGTKAVDKAAPDSEVVNGIHVPTGLIADEGYLLVRNNCIACHSLDLVKNKRDTREGWVSTIRWMQETQGLWDLGENEKPILDYLAKNYAPKDTGRRKQLTEIEWYNLVE